VSNTALQSTAQRLIAAKGAAITITRVVEGDYDPNLGTTAETTTTVSTYAVLDNYSGTMQIEDVEIGDKRLWVAGLGMSFVPQPGDKVTADGATWVVVAVDKINPDAAVYVYDLQVRK